MRTEEKIIRQAVRLFNAEGMTKISLRQIAASVGISIGNLTYHFKNKEVILGKIYKRMEAEMDEVVFPGEEQVDLFHYQRQLESISDFQYRHRFFYLDILEISRRYPGVIKTYRETVKIREKEKGLLFDALMRKKLIKAETVKGFYRSLGHAIWVMSTFWLQQKHVLGPGHPLIRSATDIDHVWEIMIPYLTKKGLRQFVEIRKSQNRPLKNEVA